ncbi:hypothetical protein PFISCL1PPCAC_9188, partial [Pristionchus fissidentatus]
RLSVSPFLSSPHPIERSRWRSTFDGADIIGLSLVATCTGVVVVGVAYCTCPNFQGWIDEKAAWAFRNTIGRAQEVFANDFFDIVDDVTCIDLRQLRLIPALS